MPVQTIAPPRNTSADADTLSRTELVVMLYDGIGRLLSEAEVALAAQQPDVLHSRLARARACVAELAASLDMDQGGEIARNLMDIYDYWNRRLVEADVKNDVAPVREVRGHVLDLKEVWEQVAAQTAS